jgi:hypothetical protein
MNKSIIIVIVVAKIFLKNVEIFCLTTNLKKENARYQEKVAVAKIKCEYAQQHRTVRCCSDHIFKQLILRK